VRYLRRGDDVDPLQAVLPVLDQLVVVKDPAGAPVSWLEFHDIVFEHTRLLTPAGGLLDTQAARDVPAAFDVVKGQNVVVQYCTFKHLGGYALWFDDGTRDSLATGNTVTDTGAGGIRTGVAVAGNTAGHNEISSNAITDTGHVMPAGVGIWVGRSFDNTVKQNLVADTTYSGISVGWDWKSTPGTAGRNTVSNNLLVNIGQGELADLGGIYAVGASDGTTTISGNLVREVRGFQGYGSGAWGLYGDQLSTNEVVTNNVVVGTDSGGYFLNSLATADQAIGNVFAWGDAAEFEVAATAQPAVAAASNVFVPRANKVFAFHSSASATFSNNAVSASATVPAASAVDASPCGAGCTTSKTVVTATTAPKDVVLSGGPSTLLVSPKAAINAAGPSDAMIGSLQVVMTRPTSQAGPPWPYTLDIAGFDVGKQPTYLTTYSKGVGSISVQTATDTAHADSDKCLQFHESKTEGGQAYDPNMYVHLNHWTGTSTTSFWVWIDAGTKLRHEWRDLGSGIGPSVTITSSHAVPFGWAEADSPPTAQGWNYIVVTAPVTGSGQTWTLQVTPPNGVTQTLRNLAPRNGGLAGFWQMYFISDATNVDTDACIAGVNADNTAYYAN